jgi:hypothetical protein
MGGRLLFRQDQLVEGGEVQPVDLVAVPDADEFLGLE